MGAWKLTADEWDEVDAFRFTTRDAREFRNGLIVLMSAAGDSKAAIAAHLGCSEATVHLVRQRYRQLGVEGLRRESPPGRNSRADAEYRETLRTVVATPPQDLGYGFSVWSAQRLSEHLKKVTGVSFSTCHFRRILKQEGCTFQRPKHTMKGKRNEAAYEQARRELVGLKKSRSGRTLPKR